MSLLDTELYLDRASIPSEAAIVDQLAQRGYSVSFFDGFDPADDAHSFWTPTTIQGRHTGFDYHIIPRAELLEQEHSESDPGTGDTCLAFVARNHNGSVLAAALTQLAICELTDAKGVLWEDESSLENGEMIDFLLDIISDVSSEIESSPDPAAHFLPEYTANQTSRLPENYSRNVGIAAAKGVVVFGLILAAPYLLGLLAST